VGQRGFLQPECLVRLGAVPAAQYLIRHRLAVGGGDYIGIDAQRAAPVAVGQAGGKFQGGVTAAVRDIQQGQDFAVGDARCVGALALERDRLSGLQPEHHACEGHLDCPGGQVIRHRQRRELQRPALQQDAGFTHHEAGGFCAAVVSQIDSGGILKVESRHLTAHGKACDRAFDGAPQPAD
jgi:hypothetical protein